MRTRLTGTSLFTPILLALLFVTAGNAFGQFDETVLYRITAKHSGKCLTVQNGSDKNGDPVIQRNCTEARSQKWWVIPVDDRYYKIISANSLKALDVFGGIVSQGNGARVEQWDDNQGDNQKWAITHEAGGYYRIEAKHSQKSLDIDGASTDSGAYAQQWQRADQDNQRWGFTESLRDLPTWRATRTVCPSTADQARLGINPYTTDPSLRQRSSFAVNETVVLTVYNDTPDSVYFNAAVNPEPLIREEGLQVERLIASCWMPVFQSGIFGPTAIRRVNSDGTATIVYPNYLSPTEVMDFRPTMTFTRRWTVPAVIGAGTYRLSFVYYHSPDTHGTPSTVCSETFVVRER